MKFPLSYNVLFAVGALFLLCNTTKANNIVISQGPNLQKIGTTGEADIVFGLLWENSWKFKHKNRYNVTNWDAAWVFAKYSVNKSAWKHVHINPDLSKHSINKVNCKPRMEMGTSIVNNESATMGLFICRDTAGQGNFIAEEVKLRWNYRVLGISETDTVKVQVFAIEMVYIPEGSYTFGDGAGTSAPVAKNKYATLYNNAGNLVVCPGNTTVVNTPISSETGLKYNNVAIPDAFPKGVKAFYCMKYEITQHAYVDFLNTLSRTQQSPRTWNANTTANIPQMGPNAAATYNTYRNFIRTRTAANATLNTAAIYGNTVNGSSWEKDENGGNIACNYMNIFDGLAYADFAGLRPMTELEYEKVCRGPLPPETGEYAWGGRIPNTTGTMQFTNTAREFRPGNFLTTGAAPWVIRVGSFAHSWTTREESGAAYYGVMNMSDNVWERVISLKDGITFFDGAHGDGELNANGYADVATWPVRDGFATTLPNYCKGWGTRGNQISNRTYAEVLTPETAATPRPTTVPGTVTTSLVSYGFRAVRTAE